LDDRAIELPRETSVDEFVDIYGIELRAVVDRLVLTPEVTIRRWPSDLMWFDDECLVAKRAVMLLSALPLARICRTMMLPGGTGFAIDFTC
jgi:hypothetical protein